MSDEISGKLSQEVSAQLSDEVATGEVGADIR